MLSCNGPKPAPALRQTGHGVDEMAKRAPQAVEPPDDERVALAQVIEQPGELDAVIERAAGGVAEDPHAPCSGQRVVLQRELLLTGRNPRIAEQRRHPGSVSQPSDVPSLETLISDTGSGRTFGAVRPSGADHLRKERLRDGGAVDEGQHPS